MVVQLMKEYDISQLPVLKDGVQVGSVRETTIMKNLSDGSDPSSRKVSEVMEALFPTVKLEDKITSPLNLMKSKNAITVLENGKIIDIITTIDIVNHFLKR